METTHLYGLILKNLETFKKAQKIGFDYLLNPKTKELHCVKGDFLGAHNLAIANLEDFIGITNIGVIEIHKLPEGTHIPIYDLSTGAHIGIYVLNKCQHCFSIK